MNRKLCAAFAASLFFAASAEAATLRLDGFTSSLETVNINAAPFDSSTRVGGSGFNMTDTSTTLGSFIAWCLDLGHTLIGVGDSQEYVETNEPFSNSYGLSDTARARVQALFDANYADLDTSNGDQAAAFQMALWESAYEDDSAVADVTDGVFQAASSGSTALANTYLAAAASYAGAQKFNMTFLEVAGLSADRARGTGQNLVTVSAVPLPAAGVLLLTALGGTALLGRRRKA
ncbi:MAG: VPLPA-CTERM sorting domain-containing protein [Pikeienuella sp.]